MTNFELAHDVILELLRHGYLTGMEEGVDSELLRDMTEVVEKELDSHNIRSGNNYDGTWG